MSAPNLKTKTLILKQNKMNLQKELKEFAKWLDGSDIKRPIEKMADHYWQEFKAQGISSNAVLKVTSDSTENKKESEVAVCDACGKIHKEDGSDVCKADYMKGE